MDVSTSTFETVILNTNGLAESIANSFVLIKPIMNTLLNYDNFEGFKNLVIYILESLICYVVVIEIMSKIYLKGAIGATINGNRKKALNTKGLSLKDFKAKSKNKAYLLKELKILTRTPIFLIQCLVMPIIYPILVFAIMIFFINFAQNVGMDAVAEIYEKLNATSGQALIIAIGQVFFMMNFCSIIAVSRESKNAIITKYIPIKLTKQFNLKITIGTLVNGISCILVSICYYACMKNTFDTILFFMILVFLNLICEKVKLLIDLRNPQITWDNEYTMMKQNTNVMYELFYTLLILGILLLFSLVIKNIGIYLVFVLAVSVIVNALINEHVYKKQEKVFGKIF